MLATVYEKHNNIDLVENSGIQFIDYEFGIDWGDKSNKTTKQLLKTVFARDSLGKDGHLVMLFPNESDDKLINPFNPQQRIDPDSPSLITDFNNTENSLRIFNGVWLPLPYFNETSAQKVGPFNWARCRIVRVPNDKFEGAYYRVVLCFDTAVQHSSQDEYLAPAETDVSASNLFSLDYRKGGTILLRPGKSGQSWVEEWVRGAFCDLGHETLRGMRIAEEDFNQALEDKEYEAHYLNILRLLGEVVQPRSIKLLSSGSGVREATEVSLVLDVGNSRSCGVLVENGGEDTDGFSGSTQKLHLRDLNAPEHVYEEAFESRVEFNCPNFEYDGKSARSGRPDAFLWPSLARVGTEAARLASHHQSKENLTGLNSPKRYLWKDESDDRDIWHFNSFSYQIPKVDQDGNILQYHFKSSNPNRPYAKPVSDYINSQGEALFAGTPDQNMTSRFTYKSCMTFMLLEIFAQALMQINSFDYRLNAKGNNARRLRAIVLTVPPSMPEQEREIYRGCAYEALGILWKSMGYDPTPAAEFKFYNRRREMNPEPPEIVMDLDEAQAGQVVYLFNESQKIYGGNCKQFLEDLIRPGTEGRFGRLERDEQKREVVSARIGSIDIGGGTTDLVISDYYIAAEALENSESVRINEVLRDGFKIAGDDILLELIRSEVLTPLRRYLKEATEERHRGHGQDDQIMQNVFGMGSDTDKSSNFENSRLQCVQQIFMKVGYRILAHLELLRQLPPGLTEATVKGTVGDFIRCNEVPSCEEINIYDHEANAYPDPDPLAIEHVDKRIREFLPDFKGIMEFPLDIDLFALNRRFAAGVGVGIAVPLTALTAIAALYQCDVMLLTGRPLRIPGIRKFIQSRLPLSPARIISLNEYECGQWYPFARRGSYIGDTKTTVTVGAALAHKKTTSHSMTNFRFDLRLHQQPSPIRYFGHIDNDNIVRDVMYEFITEGENKTHQVNCVAKSVEGINEDNQMALTRESSRHIVRATLPDDLGFRQFDSPDYPGTRLYTVECYDNVQQLKSVQDAAALDLSGSGELESLLSQLNDTQVIEECRKAEALRDVKIRLVELLSDDQAKERELEQELSEYAAQKGDFAAELGELLERGRALLEERTQLHAKLNSAAEAAATEHFKDRKSSFLGKLTGENSKLEAERQSYLADFVRSNLEVHVREPIQRRLEELRQEAERAMVKRVRTLIWENQDTVMQSQSRKLKQVTEKIDRGESFELQFSLDERNNTCPNEQLKPLWDELKASGKPLNRIFKLKLEGVNDLDGKSWNAQIRLKLKTAGSKYWTDTGMIAG
ncbi:MAG: virulence factor SrfB [Succinivibrio sp.]|nr:virulence factor SrfB [Succinivibrio sp.]